MPIIPPLSTPRTMVHPPARDLSWVTFNLFFVLAVSGLVNILLVLRLVTR